MAPNMCQGPGDNTYCYGVCCAARRANNDTEKNESNMESVHWRTHSDSMPALMNQDETRYVPAMVRMQVQDCTCNWAIAPGMCQGPGDGTHCYSVCCDARSQLNMG